MPREEEYSRFMETVRDSHNPTSLLPSTIISGSNSDHEATTDSERRTPDGCAGSTFSESEALLEDSRPRLMTLDGKPRGDFLLYDPSNMECNLPQNVPTTIINNNHHFTGNTIHPVTVSNGNACAVIISSRGLKEHPDHIDLCDVSPDCLEGGDHEEGEGETFPTMTKERLRAVAIQVFIPFLTAGFGTVAAGLVLDRVQKWPVFLTVSELFILVPALLGLKGNLEMTLAARLSTQANLGNMDTRSEQWHMSVGNMALIQCQATIVTLLASAFAIVVGHFQTQGAATFDKDHALVLTAAALITASIASLILGSLMVVVVIVARQYHINPDNVATPIAASLGDLCTLALLAVSSDHLYETRHTMPYLSAMLIALFIVLLPIWVKLARSNPYTQLALYSGWIPVVSAMTISSLGGCILDDAVSRFSGVAVFQPVINGVGGNLVAIQACKLTTTLHCSTLPGRLNSEDKVCIGCGNIFFAKSHSARTARLLLLMVVPGHLLFLGAIKLFAIGHVAMTPLFIGAYMIAALIQVTILLAVARCMIYWMWVRRIDPDNAAIPYLTALGDLLGIAFLSLTFVLMYALNDPSVSAAPPAVIRTGHPSLLLSTTPSPNSPSLVPFLLSNSTTLSSSLSL